MFYLLNSINSLLAQLRDGNYKKWTQPRLLQISLARARRGLVSPKASVGVWLLVLIVFLLVIPVVLGHIACFWWGEGVGV